MKGPSTCTGGPSGPGKNTLPMERKLLHQMKVKPTF